jgi:hypothetical protein
MNEGTREIDREAGDWILEERAPDGVFVLSVAVGWVGAYVVEHPLTREQVAAWRTQGRAVLSRLSGQINAREIAAARERLARGGTRV